METCPVAVQVFLPVLADVTVNEVTCIVTAGCGPDTVSVCEAASVWPAASATVRDTT